MRKSLEALDAMRACAALLVFVGHERNLLFQDHGALVAPGPLVSAAYFLTSLGHAAVEVFLVLSGHVIAGSVLAARRAGTRSWRRYLVSRLTRLEIVLLPALALGAPWDGQGVWALADHHPYGGRWPGRRSPSPPSPCRRA